MPMSHLRFVIIEKNELIGLDMETGLKDACPNCSIARVPDVARLGDLAPDLKRRTIFITGDRLANIDESGLALIATQQGAQIVVRAGHDTDEAVRLRGYETMPSPFTDLELVEIAKRFTPVGPVTPAA